MAIVSNTVTGSVSILISSADGTFQPKVDYAGGANPFDATAGDLNGDGNVDLVVVGAGVNVLLGNGDGTFAAPVSYSGGISPHSVKLGDFNNDHILDIGTVTNNSASVLLGNGDGTFQSSLAAPMIGNNINLVVGDFNRDGNLDMASSNTASNGTINVLRGRGDGSFDPYTSYYAFSAPVYLASGDFNHDGYDDFAVANSYAATSMSVVMNNGDGSYAAPHTYGIAATGYEIEVADFNSDGNADFAVRSSSLYMVSLGKGDGTFYPSVNYSTPAGRFEAGTHGDFNGDGSIDLAYPTSTGVTVLQNDAADAQNLAGAVTFRVTAPSTTTSGSVLPMAISAVDSDGNVATGFRGLVFISSSDPAATTAAGYAFNPNDAGIPYVFTASDAGTHAFTGAIRLVTAGDQSVKVAAPNMISGTATVAVTGQITRLNVSAPTASTAGDTFDVTVSAINSEGVVATGYSSVVHFTSTDGLAGLPSDYAFTAADAGSHTFTVSLKTAGIDTINVKETGGTLGGSANVSVSPGVVTSFALAGTDGAIGVNRPVTIVARDAFGNTVTGYNGTVDLSSSDPAAVFPATAILGNGVTTLSVKFLTVGTQTVTATDSVDTTITGTMSSDATPPIAALFTVTGYPATTAGVTNNFTVTVRDTIGQIATGYAGTIFFSSTDVQAGLPASYTFTAADEGTHTFSGTFRTAGSQSITVRDSTGTLTGTEGGIAVSPAAFSKFILSVPNGMDSKGHILVTADDVIFLTVKAVDEFGNAITDYTGTISFSSTDALAGLPADYAYVAADAGAHTFSVGLHTATINGQVWSFTATDVAASTALATITNFEVVNGLATNFAVSVPSQITAGTTFISKVTARDSWGNTVKNYYGGIHFSSSAANALLPADYTFDASDLGVHDFSIGLNSSGAQTLTVTDAANGQLTTAEAATVKAAAAAGVALSYPTATTAGAAQPLSVRVVDAYGNVADGYRGTVTFSSSDVQAGLPAAYTFSKNDAGSHTFSATLKTAGTMSLSVADPGNALSAAQTDIRVAASTVAGSFVVTGISATTAGVAQTFTVKVKDAYGNLATGYTGTVTFSSSDAQAGLPANYTFTAADGGTHVFTATLKTTGSQSITVKDASSASAGTQTGIAVSAASAASLNVVGFPATGAGVAKTFTVTARDAFGNKATGYTGTVTFSSSDAQAGLPASYAFSAADGGTHVFTATLKTTGSQSITVRDAAVATIDGSQTGILVSAGAAAKFLVSPPISVTQGVGFKFTVTVVDIFGNVVTGYRGKVHLSSTDPKSGTSDYTFSSKDSGIATFSYTFNILGAQSLKLVDTADGSIIGSAVVNVVTKK